MPGALEIHSRRTGMRGWKPIPRETSRTVPRRNRPKGAFSPEQWSHSPIRDGPDWDRRRTAAWSRGARFLSLQWIVFRADLSRFPIPGGPDWGLRQTG